MAPLPVGAPLSVRFIAGSLFSYGDQVFHPFRSLMSAKIFSGGALMLAVRWTRKESGLVAAKPSTPTIKTTTTMPSILNIDVAPYCVTTLIIQHTPNRSVTIPNRGDQKVRPSGIVT